MIFNLCNVYSAIVDEQMIAAKSAIGMHHQMLWIPVKCDRRMSDGRKNTICRSRLKQMETVALPVAWK